MCTEEACRRQPPVGPPEATERPPATNDVRNTIYFISALGCDAICVGYGMTRPIPLSPSSSSLFLAVMPPAMGLVR